MSAHQFRQFSLKTAINNLSNLTTQTAAALSQQGISPLPPPPAYTSRPSPFLPDIQASLTAEGYGDMDDSSEMDSSPLSPLLIQISTTLRIHGSNNLISTTPAASGTTITHSIVAALKEVSMSKTGIPMIDEEGRPRPIQVHVEAGIDVQGEKNVVGKEAVAVVLASRMTGRLPERNDLVQVPDRKRRAASEPSDGERAKRARSI